MSKVTRMPLAGPRFVPMDAAEEQAMAAFIDDVEKAAEKRGMRFTLTAFPKRGLGIWEQQGCPRVWFPPHGRTSTLPMHAENHLIHIDGLVSNHVHGEMWSEDRMNPEPLPELDEEPQPDPDDLPGKK